MTVLPHGDPKQRAQFLRAALLSHRRLHSVFGQSDPTHETVLQAGLKGLGVDPAVRTIVSDCVLNENVRITEPARQRRDALILLMSERPELFDATRIDHTVESVLQALVWAATRASSVSPRAGQMTYPQRRRVARVVGSNSEVRSMLLPGLMARAIRSPELSDEELFTSAVRSMLVRSAVRSVCIRNSVRSSSGPFREMAFVEQDAWLAAGVSVSNEFHRIEPYEETGDNDVGGYEVGGREAEAHRAVGQGADSLQPTTDGPRQADHESAARSGLEQEAALALGIPDPTEARLLTAVCRFALKARSNNRAAGLRSELKRRAMMEEQAISEFGEPEMTGPGVEVEALAMEESLLASALAELRRDHDPLSEDAAAALELVHRIIQEERSAASTEPSTTGLEELLGWFESNYPPLAGNYGGHASLHWSLAQVTRPHHVVWPSVNGPGPRARKFVSRLKSRFGAFSLEVER